MKKSVRLKSYSSLFATLIALPLLGAGCSEDNPISDATSALCCDDFEVGADLSGADFDLSGEADVRFKAFAQAGSDLAAVATATLDDVRLACENIARDLGATEAQVTMAEGTSGRAAVTAWCDLAVAQIDAKIGANGSGELGARLAINFEPPACEIAVNATLDCKGGCNVEAGCEVDAEPPTCTGGKLTVECSGSCMGEANAAVSCTGECTGSCTGSCTATAEAPSIQCQGRCEGECTANANGGGSGFAADGTCNGFCSGTCTPMGGTAMASCEGTCQGTCSATCNAQAGVKFTCDGECMGEFEAPKCEGGKLEVACEMDAECEASCDASASAKAECQPPRLEIGYELTASATAETQFELEAAVASLEVNLPAILLAFRARGPQFRTAVEGVVSAGGRIVANPGDLSVTAVACAGIIAGTLETASANFVAAFDASVEVGGALGIDPADAAD